MGDVQLKLKADGQTEMYITSESDCASGGEWEDMGDQSEEVIDAMTAVARSLAGGGIDAIIAGCTEIPLVLSEDTLGMHLISSTDVLAKRTVDTCLGLRALPR